MSRYLDEHPHTLLVSSLVQPIDPLGNEVLPGEGNDYWLKWYANSISTLKSDSSPAFSLMKNNFIVSTSNIFIRREYFAHHPMFNELLAYCHDYEFLLRALEDATFHLIEERLLNYRLHPLNTIKENSFLKHLEVMYAIFSNRNFIDLLSNLSASKRKETDFFRGLVENAEINPTIQLSELDSIIQEKERQLLQADVYQQDLHFQLNEAHRLLNETQNTLQETNGKLQNALGEIESQQVTIGNQRIHIEAREHLLQEIYKSRGWRLLNRLRSVKNAAERISTVVKNRIKPQHTTLPVDENTYHVRIIHPIYDRRPKIIHAIANLMMGGSSRLVVDLIEHLGHKYDQEVISYFIPFPLAYAGFPFHDFSGTWSKEEIATFLRNKEAKIVHVHYWGDCDEPWYRRIFEAAEGLPCAVIENINTPVAPLLSESIDKYVYVSDYAKNFSACVEAKALVIYPGSDVSLFKRGGASIPDDIIGMVYRLENDKLHEDSILPFIEVVRRRPQTRAIIVGGGSLLDGYKARVIAADVEDSFEFTGYVPYERLPEYYKKFSLFVAPIWKESFGQVSPFAMSMKIPVVGYNMGALSEILGSTECLARDTQELTRIIIDLLDNRQKRLEIGAANYERVGKLFSLEAMVEKYDRLYSQFLGQDS
jgi:glycosyltransferase involved in cell wall biosynthesis